MLMSTKYTGFVSNPLVLLSTPACFSSTPPACFSSSRRAQHLVPTRTLFRPGSAFLPRKSQSSCYPVQYLQPSQLSQPSILKSAPFINLTSDSDLTYSTNSNEKHVDQENLLMSKMNVICNDLIKIILRGSEEDVMAFETRLIQDHRALFQSNPQASLFFEALVFVLNHDLHPNQNQLSGVYAQAYKKIIACLEDSGWALTPPPFIVMG